MKQDNDLYFDGGIRGGNPGGLPTYGVRILNGHGQIIHTIYGVSQSKILTNNVAEWEAVKNALLFLWSYRNDFKTLDIRGDSQLVIRQLTGEYEVNAEHLKPIYIFCKRLIKNFQSANIYVTMNWYGRDYNQSADKLAEEAYHTYMETTKE